MTLQLAGVAGKPCRVAESERIARGEEVFVGRELPAWRRPLLSGSGRERDRREQDDGEGEALNETTYHSSRM